MAIQANHLSHSYLSFFSRTYICPESLKLLWHWKRKKCTFYLCAVNGLIWLNTNAEDPVHEYF